MQIEDPQGFLAALASELEAIGFSDCLAEGATRRRVLRAMCLILAAWRAHPRYPLVIAANRDGSSAAPPHRPLGGLNNLACSPARISKLVAPGLV